MKETGDIIYRKQATGKLLFKRNGESTAIDFGNVRMHKHTANVERTKTAVARKGYVEIVDERPAQIEHRWTVGLDEELPDLTRLQLLAGAGTTVSQGSGTAATESFTSVKKGQVIILAKQDVSNVEVEVATVAKTLGTDYTVDAKAGVITLLRGGTIADAATVDVTYDHAAVETLEHKGNAELTVKGTAYFDEYDQHSELPRARYTFPAQVVVSNRGDNDGKKLSEFEVELLATGQIVRRGRVDA